MGEATALDKEGADQKNGGEKKPLWWGLAVAMVILSSAVAYKIVKSDGQVDFEGGIDGIQVKVSQAQKTIASAQQEVTAAQKQLDERDTALKAREQALSEREGKLQELIATLDRSQQQAAPRAALSPARTELAKLRAAPLPAPVAPEPVAVKARIDKLSEFRDTLDKTNVALKAAAKPAAK
jgi:septal ring factor EnvC (AmiA/AmiB activator)